MSLTNQRRYFCLFRVRIGRLVCQIHVKAARGAESLILDIFCCVEKKRHESCDFSQCYVTSWWSQVKMHVKHTLSPVFHLQFLEAFGTLHQLHLPQILCCLVHLQYGRFIGQLASDAVLKFGCSADQCPISVPWSSLSTWCAVGPKEAWTLVTFASEYRSLLSCFPEIQP